MTVSYKRSNIAKLTIPDIKALVRKHNLHTNYIKNYSRLRKSDLIDKFMEHYKKSPPVDSSEPPSTPSKVPRAKPAGPAKKPAMLKKKKAKGSSKPKMTAFDKSMGLDKPLYKEGVEVGARKQFEKRYGKISEDAQALKDVQKQMESEKGRGKRQRKKKIQDPDFEYNSPKPAAKKRGRPRKNKA